MGPQGRNFKTVALFGFHGGAFRFCAMVFFASSAGSLDRSVMQYFSYKGEFLSPALYWREGMEGWRPISELDLEEIGGGETGNKILVHGEQDQPTTSHFRPASCHFYLAAKKSSPCMAGAFSAQTPVGVWTWTRRSSFR